MGLLDFIRSLFGSGNRGSERVKIAGIADYVGRFADRYRANGNEELAETAEEYAERIRNADGLNAAKRLRREFLALIRTQDHEYYDDDDEFDDEFDDDDDDDDDDVDDDSSDTSDTSKEEKYSDNS